MLGALPSVLAPPSPKVSSDRYTETLLALVDQPHIACIVTSSNLLHMLPGIFNRLSARMPVTTTEEVFAETTSGDERPLDLTCDPEAPAFLQHSSGTTGLQKGVTVTHGMLDSQMRMLEEAIGYGPEDRIVSWLPLYHDMGLVACMLFPMYAGVGVIQLSTFEWLSNPGFLLDVIEKNRGSLCWLPNFAFIHLANHQRKHPARRDLSSLRMLISCSETVHAQAFALFKEVFRDCNFSPSSLASSYALAENTFVVTQSAPGNEPMTITVDEAAFRKETVRLVESDAPGARVLVSSGRIVPQNKVEIVDDEGNVLSEGLIGEIRISGPCVLREYHNNRLATKSALSGSWYFTGDLGFIYREELFVTGRMKDLLIIAGENIYPQDVENAAMQTAVIHPGRAAAIGVYDDRTGTERLVILAERKDESDTADEEIIERIRVSVGETLGLSVSQVIVVDRGWLIKSTSGKTSRPLSYEKAIREGLL
jgi:fatty-acyl-CoA synthase